jgi:hypothetical protein
MKICDGFIGTIDNMPPIRLRCASEYRSVNPQLV